MGILEKIAEIEHEMNRTQKNKATEYHFGVLKARLAKLKQELLEPKSSGGKGEGFDVAKSGDARIVLIGFPSVGKSTFLSKVTTTQSAVAAYEFTTLTCVPGRLVYKGTRLQMLDLPGIIEGASQGKGRGRQVIAVAKTADIIVMMLDSMKGDIQRRILESELEAMGIRLNKAKPNVSFQVKSGGGISINPTIPLTRINEKIIQQILHEYKIYNAEVVLREDVNVDEFIDVILDNRVYIDCLYVYNKIDSITIEDVDKLARHPNSVVASCELDLNVGWILESIWMRLGLKRIYTKKRAEYPDFEEPVVLRRRDGFAVKDLCRRLHKNLESIFKYALVWGKSAKYCAQRVGLSHQLEDEDVVQIIKKR